jgi:hypothetical protein
MVLDNMLYIIGVLTLLFVANPPIHATNIIVYFRYSIFLKTEMNLVEGNDFRSTW